MISVSLGLLVTILVLVAQWIIFQKSGLDGWKSIIPIYNIYCLYKISWGNGWIFLATVIPLVNVVVEFMTMNKLAKSFNKGFWFGVGLFFLRPIFYVILAFSDENYIGPNGDKFYAA